MSVGALPLSEWAAPEKVICGVFWDDVRLVRYHLVVAVVQRGVDILVQTIRPAMKQTPTALRILEL